MTWIKLQKGRDGVYRGSVHDHGCGKPRDEQRCREALAMRERGCTYEEIGDALGVMRWRARQICLRAKEPAGRPGRRRGTTAGVAAARRKKMLEMRERGYTYAEIGSAMGVTAPSVYKTVKRWSS